MFLWTLLQLITESFSCQLIIFASVCDRYEDTLCYGKSRKLSTQKDPYPMGFESMGWNPCYQALPNIKLLYPDPFPVRLNYDNLILNQIGIIRQFTIHAFLPIIIKTCNRWWIETCDINRNFGTSSIWAPGNPPGFPSGISPEENSFQNMPRVFSSDSSRIFPRILSKIPPGVIPIAICPMNRLEFSPGILPGRTFDRKHIF